MHITIRGSRWGVWGLGTVGMSAVRFLHGHGAIIQVMDAKQLSEDQVAFLDAHNASFIPQEQREQFIYHNQYVLPSPGIPLPTLPDAPCWVSELDLFAQYCSTPIIAITGSVGKTTVTQLVAALLRAQGKHVAVAGNIGMPMLDLIATHDAYDYVILEVSSFQLAHIKQFAPTLAVWTNFYPNHLDWHQTVDHYFQAKCNSIRYQTGAHRALVPAHLQLPAGHSMRYRFSTTDASGDYTVHHNTIVYQEKPLIACQELPNITFVENWLISIAAVTILGYTVTPDLLRASTIAIQNHRVTYITTIAGVSYYNDSKATIAYATIAAVEKFISSSVRLFLGGLSKGVDRTMLLSKLAQIGNIKKIYCFGAEASLLYHMSVLHGISAQSFCTLDNAFAACQTEVQPGDTVLFSPAGSSFDLFAHYQERGDYFTHLVYQTKKQTKKRLDI